MLSSLRKNRKRKIVEALANRDGWNCFYCNCRLFPSEDKDLGKVHATIEHFPPASLGGPDTLENKVLACKPCNEAAGARTIVEKVKLRDMRKL